MKSQFKMDVKRKQVATMTQSHADGLFQFYSSQADLLLAQYENITQLLGPTTDWTHHGTHCETLLRDFLRRHLLKSMSVDKGYEYSNGETQQGTALGNLPGRLISL